MKPSQFVVFCNIVSLLTNFWKDFPFKGFTGGVNEKTSFLFVNLKTYYHMLEAMCFKENTVFNWLDYIVQSDNQDSLIVIVV